MFEQLDLFGPSPEHSPKQGKDRGRLVPPTVVEAETANTSTPIPDTTPLLLERAREGFMQPEAQGSVADTSAGSAQKVSLPHEENNQAAETSPEEAMQPGSSPAIPAKSGRGRKSIQEMSREAALVEIPEDSVLFSKQYYSIGEVATMFNVNASLLRFWESEFSILKPRKNKKGDRFFRPEDIKNLQLIHHLLRERKYTIEGAREFLRKSGRRKEQFEAIESLKKIRAFLMELKTGI
jgi:DNA-binding transcriptional MerR regulator